MKIRKLIVTTLLGCCMFFCFAIPVRAIETTEAEQIQQNETELSKWFDKELVGYIVEFGTAFIATTIALSSFIKSFKNVKDAFTNDTKAKEKLVNQLGNDKTEIMKSNEHTINAIKEDNESTKKAIFEDNAKTREEIEKLIKVFGIAFANDSKLVKNGAASEIMKVLGDSNENTEA